MFSSFFKTMLINNNTCVQLRGQCREVDLIDGRCIGCNTGYVIIQQDNEPLCVSIRSNCQTYDISGKCVVC